MPAVTVRPIDPQLDRVQRCAADAAARDLAAAGRTQVIMPCGTGKTRVGTLVHERLGTPGAVVFVPSLAIAAQTIRHWRSYAPALPVLAICSDDTVTDHDADPGSSAELAADADVTLDPAFIAGWLADHPDSLTVCTYQSSAKLADAQRRYGLGKITLGIFDEAHRCVSDPDSRFALALDNGNIRIGNRLFLTATPRLTVSGGRNDSREIDIISMDDPDRFGRVAYELPFGRAVELGLLVDYQVIVAVTDQRNLRRLIAHNDHVRVGPQTTDRDSAVCALALLDAVDRYRLRRIVTFHNSITDAADFADDIAHLGQASDRRLHTAHVNGMMDDAQRETIIEPLREPDSSLEPYLVTNARVLGEGVDLPALDAVAFAQPRSSKLEIIQAVGRAMRTHPAKQVATIVLPVVLSESDDEPLTEEDAWEPCWAALRALRDHDPRVSAVFAARARDETPAGSAPRVIIGGRRLPAGFERAFAAEVILQTTSNWEQRAAELEGFCRANGHLPSGAQDASAEERRAFQFYANQRALRVRGSLTARQIARLEAIPHFHWSKREQNYERTMAELRGFISQHGRLPRPYGGGTPGEARLAKFLYTHREARRAGTLDPARERDLAALPGWTWAHPFEAAWHATLQDLRAFTDTHGRLPLTSEFSSWPSKQRAAYREGRLNDEQIAALESVPGWTWDPKQAEWDRRYRELVDWVAEHGSYPGRKINESLSMWCRSQRNAYRAGRLTDTQIRLLEQVPGHYWTSRTTSGR